MKKLIDFNTKLPEELTSTKKFKWIKYPFEFFNKVQSFIVNKQYYAKDYNLVLATNTSTGKTICAELFMGWTLYKEKQKVVYVSPLKSLTQEKYDDWKIKFPDKEICILTSDYSDDDKIVRKLLKSDIICITSEMLDSKTRSKKSLMKWGINVGLIIIDEFHILDMEGRGHAVESGLMRFCKEISTSRLLCLSATVPNVDDFRRWFINLNGKHTIVIKSDWRPVELDFHYVPMYSQTDYKMAVTEKVSTVSKLVNQKQDEKYLVFVHDKNTGRRITQFLKKEGIMCEFHNADLNFKERMEIENDFSDKKNGNRVLVSTSTLAWGRSLPARNVIIAGSTRANKYVDEFDILQMAGRAGRLGIDDKGDCYFCTHNIDYWKTLLKDLKPVSSTLLEKDYLEFQILAEIAIGNVYNLENLVDWYEKSLSYIQEWDNPEIILKECLINLKDYGMIDITNENLSIKSLGKVSAHLYFLPKDVKSLQKKLYKINIYNDYTYSYLYGYDQSWSLPYVPSINKKECNEYAKLFNLKTGIRNKACIVTTSLYKYFSKKEKNVYIFNVLRDMKRIESAIEWISSICKIDYEKV